MPEVVTLGEAMLRLSPRSAARLEQATRFDVVVGGSEQSVAVGLANLDREAGFITKLPNNPLGRLIRNRTREQGVDVSHVVWSDARAGLYFYEQGAAPRPSSVLYDRAGSAASTLQPADVDWDAAFAGCRLFHTSGITAALSASCFATVEHALSEARRLSAATSFDLNYRSRLWSVETAARAYQRLAPLCAVLFASADALMTFFRMSGTPREMAQQCRDQYGCDAVVLTERQELGAASGSLRALAVAAETVEGDEIGFEIVDRLGAGDAFAAGFLDGYLDGDLPRAIAQGTAMAALKHTIPGEFCLVTRQELRQAMAGDARQVVR